MKRINIIGTTGSGKSTLALALSEQLGYPYVQIDQIFWKPNWQGTPDEEFHPKLAEAISGDCWVLDGNYNRTNEIKWKRADTIIWLDFGYTRTLFQLIKRTLNRVSSQQELWSGTGNRETFYKSFMSKDSIIIWFFRHYGENRSRYTKLMQSTDCSHIEMIHLTSPAAVNAFLKKTRNERVCSDLAEARRRCGP